MPTRYATQTAVIDGHEAEVRRETLRGREHLVAPITLVREMVLKGELLPFDEIERTALAWNGKPLTLLHPRDEAGNFLPASAPNQADAIWTGFTFNVQPNPEGRSLEGEAWIDIEGAAAIAAALDRDDPVELIEAGETVENSVGYWYDRLEGAGDFEGDEYTAAQANVQPDHTALLPNTRGECSIEDGCGVGRDTAGAALSAPLSRLQRALPWSSTREFATACDCGDHDDNDQSDMADNDRITALAEVTAFDEETLQEMGDDALAALEATLEEVDTDAGDDDSGTDTDAEVIAANIEERILDAVDERLASFEREQTDEQRRELTAHIAAQTDLDEDDLEGFTLAQMERIAEALPTQAGVFLGAGASALDANDDTYHIGASMETMIGGEH